MDELITKECTVRTVWCSDYLRQQELAHGASARALVDALPPRLGCLISVRALFSRRLRRRIAEVRHQRAFYLRQIEKHKGDAWYWAKGRAGEDALNLTLSQRLGDEYILLRNYTPPDRGGGDIDAVLLGPRGVTVFEVKAWTGEYLARGREWLWRPNPAAKWEPARANPITQARRNSERVKNTLRRAGLGYVPVQGVVAVSSPEMRVHLEPPIGAYVFYACAGDVDIRWLWRNLSPTPLAPAARRKISAALLPQLAEELA